MVGRALNSCLLPRLVEGRENHLLCPALDAAPATKEARKAHKGKLVYANKCSVFAVGEWARGRAGACALTCTCQARRWQPRWRRWTAAPTLRCVWFAVASGGGPEQRGKLQAMERECRALLALPQHPHVVRARAAWRAGPALALTGARCDELWLDMGGTSLQSPPSSAHLTHGPLPLQTGSTPFPCHRCSAITSGRRHKSVSGMGEVPPPALSVHAAMLLAQVLNAVAFLHARNIVHRSISLHNILVDEQGQALRCALVG